MDLESGEVERGDVDAHEGDSVLEKAKIGGGALGMNVKDIGSISSKDLFVRADRIDFNSWDMQFEKHVGGAWSKDREAHTKKEEWQIELAKLDIRNVLAHGTYGTVYRGVYDG